MKKLLLIFAMGAVYAPAVFAVTTDLPNLREELKEQRHLGKQSMDEALNTNGGPGCDLPVDKVLPKSEVAQSQEQPSQTSRALKAD